MLARLILALGGLAMAIPGGGDLNLNHLELSAIGLVLAGVAVVLAKSRKRYVRLRQSLSARLCRHRRWAMPTKLSLGTG